MARDFLLSDELREFQTSLEKFFTQNFSPKYIRARMLDNTAAERNCTAEELVYWRNLLDTGALLAPVPEDLGGLGFGTSAAQLLIYEAGRSLSTLPIFETVALGLLPLLRLGAPEAKSSWIAQITEQGARATGAFEEFMTQVANLPHIVESAGTYRLTGQYRLVPGAERADIILIPAQLAAGSLGLFALKGGFSHLLKPIPTMDFLRPYAELTLGDHPVELVSSPTTSAEQWDKVRHEIMLLSAAEMTGATQFLLDLTTDFAKTRQQFGKPIGSFQAVAHHLADMLLKVESIFALSRFCSWAVTEDPAQLAQAALACKAYASEVLPQVADKAIQVHGGIGFTYEYDLHLYLRRIRTLSSTLGGASSGYATLGEALLL